MGRRLHHHIRSRHKMCWEVGNCLESRIWSKTFEKSISSPHSWEPEGTTKFFRSQHGMGLADARDTTSLSDHYAGNVGPSWNGLSWSMCRHWRWGNRRGLGSPGRSRPIVQCSSTIQFGRGCLICIRRVRQSRSRVRRFSVCRVGG